MRLEFRQTPWDLVFLIVYTVLVSALFIVFQLPLLVGLLLVLPSPGYVLFATLFPRDKDFNWIQRVCLSVGLGILIVASIGALSTITPWGAQPLLTMIATAALAVLLGLAAAFRRFRLAPELRLGLQVILRLPSWSESRSREKVLTAALGAGLLAVAVTLGYLMVTPDVNAKFTNFYVLCWDGTANVGCYPSRLNVSQAGTIILGLDNHESVRMNYTIRVDLVGVRSDFNATSGQNETVEVNRTVLTWYNFTVPDEDNVTQRYTFTISSSGSWKLQFLLYKNDLLTNQELHLFITVP